MWKTWHPLNLFESKYCNASMHYCTHASVTHSPHSQTCPWTDSCHTPTNCTLTLLSCSKNCRAQSKMLLQMSQKYYRSMRELNFHAENSLRRRCHYLPSRNLSAACIWKLRSAPHHENSFAEHVNGNLTCGAARLKWTRSPLYDIRIGCTLHKLMHTRISDSDQTGQFLTRCRQISCFW